MRLVLMTAALVAVVGGSLSMTPSLSAQTPAYPAESVIGVAEAEVRCGPSDKFYITSKLRQGEHVFVLSEVKNQPGWLAIKPPPGAFSWVNGKQVKMSGDGRLGFVEASDGSPVNIRPGSAVVNQEPDVNSLQLKAGESSPLELKAGMAIAVVDKALSVGGQTWLPITPHPSEVRFIKADAVKSAVAVATNSAPNWTLKDNFFSTNPLLADADQAAKTGNVERAKQLYQEAANRTGDQNQKVYALARLSELNRTNSTAPWLNPGTNTTSFSPSPAPGNSAAGAQATLPPQWSGYGRLRATSLQVDGQPVYSLESDRGQPLAYVTSRPGFSLREVTNRTVAVFGPTIYRGDGARMQYIVATHFAMP